MKWPPGDGGSASRGSLLALAGGLALVVLVAVLEGGLDGRTWLTTSIAWTLWVVQLGLEGAAVVMAHRCRPGQRALVAVQAGGLVVWLVLLGLSLWLVAVTLDLVEIECFSPTPRPGPPRGALALEALAMLVILGLAARPASGSSTGSGAAAGRSMTPRRPGGPAPASLSWS
jgi:hypothetical protein